MPENDICLSTAMSTSLPRPYKINGRYVIPWPGFKVPGAAALMRYWATSKDDSNIPPKEVLVCYFITC